MLSCICTLLLANTQWAGDVHGGPASQWADVKGQPTTAELCEDLADVVKKGKKKCKLAKKCNKLGPNSKPKLAKKCKRGYAKDACKKYNKKTGTCKKKGKNVCPKTCCNLSIGGDLDCQAVCQVAYTSCEAKGGGFLCDLAKAACLALC